MLSDVCCCRTQFSTSSLPFVFLSTEFTTSSNQTSLSLFLPSSKDYLAHTVTRHCRFRPSFARGLPRNTVVSLLRSDKTTRSRALTSGVSWRSWYLKRVSNVSVSSHGSCETMLPSCSLSPAVPKNSERVLLMISGINNKPPFLFWGVSIFFCKFLTFW